MRRNELFERRKHKRVKFDTGIKCREVISDDFLNDNRDFILSHGVDISKGGMQIMTDRPWAETGDRLIEAEFCVMSKSIKLIAHIVWFTFDPKSGKYRSGVEFIVIKSGDVEAIGQMA